MSRLRWLFGSLATMLGLTWATPQPGFLNSLEGPYDDEPLTVATWSYAVTRLECIEAKTGRLLGWGSGVWLEWRPSVNPEIISAAHVYEECPSGDLYSPEYDTHFSLVAVDTDKDLVVLRADDRVTPALKLRVDPSGKYPRVGSLVWIVGFPGPMETTRAVTQGIVEAIKYTIDAYAKAGPRPLLVTDGMVYFGNSGGGFLNEKGEIIGIAHAIMTSGGYHAALATPAPDILDFLNSIR